MMTDDITLSKTNADGRKYFSLFDKYIPANLTKSSTVLLYSISNVDCIANIIEKNPDCTYYIYDSEDICDAVCCCVERASIYYVKDFEYIIENDMKFDCIIMNPPYNGNSNLYGKLTAIAKAHAKDVICLSPYLNYLDNSQKKSNRELSAKLMKHLQSYELIDPRTFDACFDKKLCVFHFVDTPTAVVDVNDIYWNEFANPALTKSIITKMTCYNEHCYSHIINKTEFDNHTLKVAFSGIRGNRYGGIPSWDWTTIQDKVKMKNFCLSSSDKGDLMGFPFNSEIECKNFVKYINSDIFEYMILIQKNSITMDKWLFKKIPYMPMYTKEWTDSEIAEEIGLTNDELNYIYDEMKPYGWKTREQLVNKKN